jgi:hypothetical protein
VVVSSTRSFSSGSFYHVVGEVVNNTPAPVWNILLTITLYDSSDGIILERDYLLLLNRTNPGQRTGFNEFYALTDVEDVARYDVQVSDYNTEPLVEYQDLAVLSIQTEETFLGTRIYGEVRNDQQEQASSARIDIILYDTAGEVLDVTSTSLASLAAGATTSYDAYATESWGAAIADIQVRCEGNFQ